MRPECLQTTTYFQQFASVERTICRLLLKNRSRGNGKRARTSLDEEKVPLDVREDEEFWLEDGTLILLAGNVKFRVYRGVFTEHSPLFVEMLSLPQPAEFQDAQHSCLVIRLHDHPESLRHVFRLLMPRKNATFVTDRAPTFDMVSAYIRIAHKYQMDTLLTQWLGYLKKHFTTSFHAWITHEHMVPDGFHAIHAIGVVNLARLTGCTSMLPTALAVCTTLGDEIVTGFKRDDGTCEQLSMADLGRCFELKGHLIQANAVAVADTLSNETASDRCNTDVLCLEHIESFFAGTRSFWAFNQLAPEGLVPPWRRYAEEISSDFDVCRSCLEMLEEHYHNAQRSTWSRLPGITGVQVEGWH